MKETEAQSSCVAAHSLPLHLINRIKTRNSNARAFSPQNCMWLLSVLSRFFFPHIVWSAQSIFSSCAPGKLYWLVESSFRQWGAWASCPASAGNEILHSNGGSLADWGQQCPGHPLGSSGAMERDCFPLLRLFAPSQQNEETNKPPFSLLKSKPLVWPNKLSPWGRHRMLLLKRSSCKRSHFHELSKPPWHTRTHQPSVDLSNKILLGVVDRLATLTLRSQGRTLLNWATGYSLSQNKRKLRQNFIFTCHGWRYSVRSGSEPNSLFFQP